MTEAPARGMDTPSRVSVKSEMSTPVTGAVNITSRPLKGQFRAYEVGV